MCMMDGQTHNSLFFLPTFRTIGRNKAHELEIKRSVLSGSNSWGTGLYSSASLLFTTRDTGLKVFSGGNLGQGEQSSPPQIKFIILIRQSNINHHRLGKISSIHRPRDTNPKFIQHMYSNWLQVINPDSEATKWLKFSRSSKQDSLKEKVAYTFFPTLLPSHHSQLFSSAHQQVPEFSSEVKRTADTHFFVTDSTTLSIQYG